MGGGADGEDSSYADVPSEMFYCHLCKKHMWDSTSFENHIKGRTHQMMREGVEESYRLKANMIRQEAKIDEQLKSIEVERLKRIGKNMKASNVHREYCTMCDLHFYGHLSTHRKSEGHLNLKKFLHPRCSECSKEFPTRIEFDAHLLSREHMIKAAAKANRNEVRRKNQLVILTETDELKDLRDEKKAATTAEGAAGAEGAVVAAEEGGDGAEKDAEKDDAAKTAKVAAEEEAETEVEPEDVILDFIEGVTEIGADVEAKLPKYNSTRPIGSSMIAKLECYECKLCNRYLDTAETAEVHARTTYHHRQFSKFLTEKATETKIAQKRAAATIENEKRKKARLEKADESQNNGDGGDGAEPMAEAEAEPTAVVAAVVATIKSEPATEEKEQANEEAAANESELYDPCEATDEDVAMTSVEVKVEPVVVATPAPASTAAAPVAAVPAAVKPAVVAATPKKPMVAAAASNPIAAKNTPTQQRGGGGGAGGRGGNRGTPNRGRGRGRRF